MNKQNELENMLKQGKQIVDRHQVPEEELDRRLRARLQATVERYDVQHVGKLNAVQKYKPISHRWKYIAVLVLLFITILVTTQHQALAYITRAFFSHEQLVSSTIEQLYKEGKGQDLDVTVMLFDGTVFTLNWIVADENQTIINYTLNHELGLSQAYIDGDLRLQGISGWFTNARFKHGTTITEDDGKTLRGTAYFAKVSPFAKKLVLHFDDSRAKDDSSRTQWVTNYNNSGEITFKYNSSQALETVLKKSIRHKFTLADGDIVVQKITATPTETVVIGKYHLSDKLFSIADLSGLKLYVNGVELEQYGSGKSSGLNGQTFKVRYTVLPKNVQEIKLVLEYFMTVQPIQATWKLDAYNETPTMYEYDNHKIYVYGVTQANENTKVIIKTKAGVLLENVTLNTDDGVTSLIKTVDQMEFVDENGEVWLQRSLVFSSKSKAIELQVRGLKFEQPYYESITILNK